MGQGIAGATRCVLTVCGGVCSYVACTLLLRGGLLMWEALGGLFCKINSQTTWGIALFCTLRFAHILVAGALRSVALRDLHRQQTPGDTIALGHKPDWHFHYYVSDNYVLTGCPFSLVCHRPPRPILSATFYPTRVVLVSITHGPSWRVAHTVGCTYC